MRDLKFRAWDNEFKTMGKVVSLTRLEQTPFTLIKNEDKSIALARPTAVLEIMQFTGLLDKNGKEIFEGDIVHCYLEDGGAYQDLGNHVVKYDDCAFRAMYCLAEMTPIIVVGNIHENPELLNIPAHGSR